MPISVMPIWIVDKNVSGLLANLRAVRAARLPVLESASRRDYRADTIAISDIDNKPFKRISPIIMTISIQI